MLKATDIEGIAPDVSQGNRFAEKLRAATTVGRTSTGEKADHPVPKRVLKPLPILTRPVATKHSTKQVSFSSSIESIEKKSSSRYTVKGGPVIDLSFSDDLFITVGQASGVGQSLAPESDRAQPSRFIQSLRSDGLLNRGIRYRSSPPEDGSDNEHPPGDEDPEKTLVNDDDNDSSDSDSTLSSDGEDSDSEMEEKEVEEEDPAVSWRASIPDYHQQTLAVLDRISQVGRRRFTIVDILISTESHTLLNDWRRACERSGNRF